MVSFLEKGYYWFIVIYYQSFLSTIRDKDLEVCLKIIWTIDKIAVSSGFKRTEAALLANFGG